MNEALINDPIVQAGMVLGMLTLALWVIAAVWMAVRMSRAVGAIRRRDYPLALRLLGDS